MGYEKSSKGVVRTTNDGFKKNEVTITVDLVDAARKQLDFLKTVDQHPNLYNSKAVIQKAIYRYEQLWLPLAAANHLEELAAPLDIHWVWHCHMLAPYFYEKDCIAIAGAVVDHKLMSDQLRQAALERAEELWEDRYKSEPFEVDIDVEQSPCNGYEEPYLSKCSYDLEAAVGRQRMFFYQVSLPHYGDRKFLENAISRYRKYLLLKKQNPDTFLVPCYDFDLVWHAHQLHPLLYKKDTTNVLGKMFNHDDSVNDREPDSKLMRSDKHTRNLWKETFGEDFALNGCMFRGEPSTGKLGTVSVDQIFPISSKMAEMIINKSSLQNVADNGKIIEQIIPLMESLKDEDTLNMVLSAFRRLSPCMLTLQAGSFQTYTMPENVEQLWGPIPLTRLPEGVPNTCIVASHKLFNHAQQLKFICSVIHSIPLMMSAVQVYFGDKMACVSHLIGADQLPRPSQVTTETCVTLDTSAGERAMIIKDAYGDWGICLGRWMGFHQGNPGEQGIPISNDKASIHDSPGHLSIHFYNLKTEKWHHIQIPDQSCNFSFNIENIHLSLKTGEMTIQANTEEMAQNVCLGFTIAVLHVLCQPRSLLDKGKVVTAPRGSRPVHTIDSESLPVVVAAGYMDDTPCNSYIKNTLCLDGIEVAAGGDVAACGGTLFYSDRFYV